MINLALSLLTTILVFLLTYLTMRGMVLPLYMNVLVFMVSYLFIKEIKYEVKK